MKIELYKALQTLWDDSDRPLSMFEMKREYVRFAIAQCHGDVSKAARKLRIGRSSIYRMFPKPGEIDFVLETRVRPHPRNIAIEELEKKTTPNQSAKDELTGLRPAEDWSHQSD